MKEKLKDITFHYTNEKMVVDLLSITPITQNQSVLDAGSGKNKVWFNNIANSNKFECELEDGNDFMDWQQKVDWIVGNPPFHISWKFTEKAMEIAEFGIAWLVNNQALNSHFTPRRIEIMQSKGFYLQKIQVVADKRWFGRYYYLIFSKSKNELLTCQRQTY
jgi:hypothetical protein